MDKIYTPLAAVNEANFSGTLVLTFHTEKAASRFRSKCYSAGDTSRLRLTVDGKTLIIKRPRRPLG